MRVPLKLVIAASTLLGMAGGLGAFTFVYAKGSSYMTNDPKACANCHIMTEQYEGWIKGSHHAVAVCNDCHAPHDFVGKYMTKARNGFWHSYYFTTQTFHEPIRIGARNLAITESACRDCHRDMVEAIATHPGPGGEASCVRCHPSVGHREFGAVGSVKGGAGQ
jgi:cytochrome c nitrite reductase small subunit